MSNNKIKKKNFKKNFKKKKNLYLPELTNFLRAI